MTGQRRQRLSAHTLAHARASLLPEYERSGAPVIAHLGFGAFARAHVAVYADELMRRGTPALISGVALRSRRAQEQLEPQDGLFTLAVREPGAAPALQVVGALASMETGPAAALTALTAATTKLVTLTITENGYSGSVGEETASGAVPSSAPALIALSLDRRRRAGLPPPVFAPLDNLLDNGTVLRTRVLDEAERMDDALAAWIASEVRFPSSVVDRMVPAPTETVLEEIAEELGLSDEAAVAAERHRSWIIRSVEGLLPLADVGVQLVDDVAPFERRKLWLLNGPHSAVAYGGLLAGHATIAAAVTDPLVARFARVIVEETLEVAPFPPALQPAAFAAEALRRFANPALGHTSAQVGADGSTKLPQRLLPVVAAREARSLGTSTFALVTAIWLAAAGGVDVPGVRLPLLADPLGPRLRSAAARADGLQALSRVALGDSVFAGEVACMLDRLTEEGLSLLEAAR
jgi:mannitol-1-phosphate/altronate dehydrogenase